MNNSDSSQSFLAKHMMDVPRSGIRDFFEIVSTRDDVISLGIGEPNFVTPQHVLDVAIDALKHGETGYTDNLGILELRQEISKYVKSSFGVEYAPETEVLVTVGVSEALDLAIRAITEPGDEIIYHEPGYVSYAPTIIFAHGKPVRVCTRKEDAFSLTRAQVEEKITDKTKALLLNFPTNPTGAVLERKDVEEIAELCIERDILVITDEVYSELTYDNAEHVSIASIPGMKERTILLHGFSKAWAMTGFRMGFSCSTPTLTAAMMKIHQYSMMCAPTLSQIAAIEALANGDNDIIEMRDDYQKRRDYIVSSFNEMGIPCHAPKGAFYAFPYIGDTGLTSHEFAMRLLEEKKVACVPGTAFGAAGEGFLRASYATDMHKIKEAMPLMADFIASLK